MDPRLVLAACATTLMSSCASIVSGSTQDVRFRTNVPDARMKLSNGQTLIGGGTVQLDRNQPLTVHVEREGYQPRSVSVETGMNGWIWGNLAFGPFFVIGILVDAMSGAVTTLTPGEVYVDLEPLPHSVTGVIASNPVTVPALAQPALQAEPAVSLSEPAASIDVTSARRPSKTLAAPAQRSWVVAVMNMEGGNQEGLLLALSDQMRVFLAQRRVRVIDRGAQEEALRGLVEEEKQRSYGRCVDESCQIPLGKALAASHILRSAMARFGATCTTNGELIDLKTEVTIAAGSARSDCSEEGLLDATERLAEELIKSSSSS